jgi:hypothetical protein
MSAERCESCPWVALVLNRRRGHVCVIVTIVLLPNWKGGFPCRDATDCTYARIYLAERGVCKNSIVRCRARVAASG